MLPLQVGEEDEADVVEDIIFFFCLSFRGRIVLLLERKDRREDL